MSRRQPHAARTTAPPRSTIEVWGWVALLGGLALVAGCFNPPYSSGGLACAGGAGGVCPGGFYCASDSRCWRVGEQPPPPPVDGAETDAAVVDAGDLPPGQPPVLVTPASANPPVVTGNSVVLSVQAENPQGEGSGLTYQWSSTGPSNVAFTVNTSSTASETTVIFMKAGHYSFTVTIVNREGLSVSSMVDVDVQAKLAQVVVEPQTATVGLNQTQQFTAKPFDQFGDPIASVPPRWQLVGNCGVVNENGLLTAGATMAANCTLLAIVGSVSGVATVSVGTTPPTVLTPVADTFVEDGAPDKNNGGATMLVVKTQNDSTNNRTAYLKFSLAGVSGPVTNVKFRLFGRAFGGTHQLGVFPVADSSWGETTLTFKNRPPLSPRLATTGVTTAPKYHEWDITSHLQTRLAAGDMLVTLAVQMVAPINGDPDVYDSKEANNKPQLVLTP